MACLKCGRDTQPGQVFCENCLEIMEYYPVKPGTAVQLPKNRPVANVRKAPKRKAPSLEEQIRILRQRLRLLTVSLIIALLIIALLAFPVYEHFMEETFRPGQNYSTIVHTEPPVTGTAGN